MTVSNTVAELNWFNSGFSSTRYPGISGLPPAYIVLLLLKILDGKEKKQFIIENIENKKLSKSKITKLKIYRMCSSGPLVAELKLLITAQSSRNIFRSPGYATLVSRVRIPTFCQVLYQYWHIYSKKAC